MGILDLRGETFSLPMPGLEPDNLLAFMALMGLLRALETAQPDWKPRAFWQGPPWVAHLELAEQAERNEVANAANEGILALLFHFDVDNRKNVDFTLEEYRSYARRVRVGRIEAALASALTVESPSKKNGDLQAAPLVMMFGQGHQNFLNRLIEVPSGALPNRLRMLKTPPDIMAPAKIAEALFHPWRREDDADGFRWDPDEDQRYALRYDDPSRSGAALTMIGANRLAAVEFLSFSTAASERELRSVGAVRKNNESFFIWPIWLTRLSRPGIEALLARADLLDGRCEKLRMLGVAEVFRARRIANGKFMNLTRAQPIVN